MQTDPHVIEWRRQSAWLFTRAAQILWLVSAGLACFKLWNGALYALGNAIAAYMIARMNSDMAHILIGQPEALLQDQKFYAIRRNKAMGHGFLLQLAKDPQAAAHLKSMSGGEFFEVDGQTILAWYQQAIGRELR